MAYRLLRPGVGNSSQLVVLYFKITSAAEKKPTFSKCLLREPKTYSIREFFSDDNQFYAPVTSLNKEKGESDANNVSTGWRFIGTLSNFCFPEGGVVG